MFIAGKGLERTRTTRTTDTELLAEREAVYKRTKSLNPARGADDIRIRIATGAVSLTPGELQESVKCLIIKNQTKKKIKPRKHKK